jgi:hypothetical protein
VVLPAQRFPGRVAEDLLGGAVPFGSVQVRADCAHAVGGPVQREIDPGTGANVPRSHASRRVAARQRRSVTVQRNVPSAALESVLSQDTLW